ncbi:MAG: hypothetical protein ACI86M_001008 [Saprospiraceae bacterium]|jgi:hypothetical protein
MDLSCDGSTTHTLFQIIKPRIMTYQVKMQGQKTVAKIIKKAIAGFLMLIFYTQVWGTGLPLFSEGAQLFVMANSGLTLRAQPNSQSESLGVVGFGFSVLVLTQPDSIDIYEKIEWVEGNWVYVEHEGVTGYMFDGYLSDLPLPTYDFEKCQLDMDLIYPLESWTEVNLGLEHTDTLNAGTLRKLTSFFEAGDKMIQTHKNDEYKVELYLKDIRVMDAYHLLLSMLDGKEAISTFKDMSTFIEDNNDELYKIMVDIDNPIWIRKLKNGDVKITVKTLNYLCGL